MNGQTILQKTHFDHLLGAKPILLSVIVQIILCCVARSTSSRACDFGERVV